MRDIPFKLNKERYEFNSSRTQDFITKKKGYTVLYWMVALCRVDKNGNEFENDNITVKIFEDYGPVRLSVSLDSIYEEIESEPLFQEKIESIAYDYAFRLTKEGGIASYISPGTFEQKPKSVRKIITSPNFIHLRTDLPGMKDLNNKVRLIWEVVYGWTDNDPKSLTKELTCLCRLMRTQVNSSAVMLVFIKVMEKLGTGFDFRIETTHACG